MNITCEHCGGSIDIEKNLVCPSCKKSFKSNKMYIELLKMKENDKKIKLESNSFGNNNSKNYSFPTIIIRVIVGFTIFFVIMFILTLFFIFSKFTDTSKDSFNDFLDDYEDTQVVKTINVDFNEKADNGKFSIICDKISINEFYDISGTINTPPDNYKYVTLHFLLDNYSNESIFFNSNVQLEYDKNVIFSQFDFLRQDLMGVTFQYEKKDGYYTFMIEKNINKYTINIGNYIYINVDEEVIDNELY